MFFHFNVVQCTFNSILYQYISVADLGGFRGFDRTPLWAAPSCDDRLTGTHLSGYRTKEIAVMAHLSML